MNRLLANSMNSQVVLMSEDDMLDEVEENLGRMLLPIQIVYSQHNYDDEDEYD